MTTQPYVATDMENAMVLLLTSFNYLLLHMIILVDHFLNIEEKKVSRTWIVVPLCSQLQYYVTNA